MHKHKILGYVGVYVDDLLIAGPRSLNDTLIKAVQAIWKTSAPEHLGPALPVPRLADHIDTVNGPSDEEGEKEAKRHRSEPTTPISTSSRLPYEYDEVMGITQVGPAGRGGRQGGRTAGGGGGGTPDGGVARGRDAKERDARGRDAKERDARGRDARGGRQGSTPGGTPGGGRQGPCRP